MNQTSLSNATVHNAQSFSKPSPISKKVAVRADAWGDPNGVGDSLRGLIRVLHVFTLGTVMMRLLLGRSALPMSA